MTYETRLPSELTDAELSEAIHYWERNRDLVSAEPILFMHLLGEQRRRLAVTLRLGHNSGTFDFADAPARRPSRAH